MDHDERELLAATIDRLCVDLSATEAAREVGPTGIDRRLWDALVELGVVSMGAPDGVGGADAGPAELAVVASALGRHVAAVPYIETVVALRLAHAVGVDDAELAALVASGAVLSLALADAVDGRASLVPAGAVATRVLVKDERGVRWLTPGADGCDVVAVSSEAAVGPLADLSFDGAAPLLTAAAAADRAWAHALAEWRLLVAAALVGVGAGALAEAVRYVGERHAFGGPIARFQTIQHRLADRATDLDAARLLTDRALLSPDPLTDPLVPMAGWASAAAADAAAREGLHFHGGYGFMEEYDAQLFLRRSTGLRLLRADPDRDLDEIVRRLRIRLGGAVDTAPVGSAATATATRTALAGGRASVEDEAFRREVLAFIDDHVQPEMLERAHRSGTLHDRGLHRAIAARGWLAAWWSGEERDDLGGSGAISGSQVTIMMEELQRVGAPIDGTGIAMMVATTLRHVGNRQQLDEVLPAILAGELLPCLGYSEPDAGSDVAAATTRAERDGDGWVVNGQKMFTTLAEEADVVFLLARTDPAAAKHRGLSLFLVPMDAPGVEVRAMSTLGGERTNVTFYQDVRVPDTARVGPLHGGWGVMSVALAFERNAAVLGSVLRLFDLGWQWATTPGVDGRVPLDDPSIARVVARVALDCEAAASLGDRAGRMTAAGEVPVVEGSMTKLFTTERYQSDAAALTAVLGPDGLRAHGQAGAPAAGWIEHAARHAVVTTIAAGTSEIQREIIAQQGLGLPRQR